MDTKDPEKYKEYTRRRNKVLAMIRKLQRHLENNTRYRQRQIQSNSGSMGKEK